MAKVVISDKKGLVVQKGQGSLDILDGVLNVGIEKELSGAGLVSTDTLGAAKTRVSRQNGEIVTTIKVDLTGMTHGSTLNDVIGLEDASSPLLQYRTATHGILHRVEISCLETPTAQQNPIVDFDITSDDEALAEDAAPSNNNVAVYAAAANTAVGTTIRKDVVGQPADGQFLHLCIGADPGDMAAAPNDVFTAGQLVIRLFGSDSF